MPTNTFFRTISITDQQSLEKIKQLIFSPQPTRQLSKPLYSSQERERARELLSRCFSKVKKSEIQL